MTTTSTTTSAELVSSARAHVEALDPDRFASEAGRPGTVVIDVREVDERLSGTIPGAIHIPRGMLEFRADPASFSYHPHLAPGRRLLLHSASGRRSALAAETLRALGYEDVAHLEGGIQAWRDAGLPVVNAVVDPY